MILQDHDKKEMSLRVLTHINYILLPHQKKKNYILLHKTKLNNNNNLAQVITFSIFKKNNSNVWNHLCSIKMLDIYNNKKKNFTILFLFNLLNKNNNLAQVIRFSIFKKKKIVMLGIIYVI